MPERFQQESNKEVDSVFGSRRRTGVTVKPSMKQLIQKYSGTNIDPLKLIRKYQNSKTTLPPTISRKYPVKYVPQDDTDDDEDDKYSKYTTASTFRQKVNKTEPNFRHIPSVRFGGKLFDAGSIKISPKLTSTSIDEHENVNDVQNRNHDSGRVQCAMFCNVCHL